jgi:hypothetical protein
MSTTSWNPYSWAMKAVSSPDASRSNKKRKVDDVDDADDADDDGNTTNLTLESIMGEIKNLKKSNERIEDLLKTLVEQTKGEDDYSEEEEKIVDGGDDDGEEDVDCSDEEKRRAAEEEMDPEEYLHPTWLAKFEDLRKFKGKHGHMRIARGSGESPDLGRWMIRQRSENKTGRMTFSAAKKTKLDSIDFDWAPQVNTPTKKK